MAAEGWLWRHGSVLHYWDAKESLPICKRFASRENRWRIVEPLAKDCCGPCRRRVLARRKKATQGRLFA